MVVVHDEVFEELGIDRSNQARRAVEEAARQLRGDRAPVSRRVDTEQPMYATNRASHSGGGAMDAWALLLLLPLAWVVSRRRWAHQGCR
jgi:hypothetical protein